MPEKKEWKSASLLKQGDKVLLSSGEYSIIETVKSIYYEEPQTTYNFEVEDYHTYYVGTGVCVHNRNCGTPDLYRGDNDMTARPNVDVKIKDGLVQPTRGVSVNADASVISKFGAPHKLGALPEGLKVVLTSGTHFEIAPAYAMTFDAYQNLLYQIPLIPV